MIQLGKNREVFWDDYLIDTERLNPFHRIKHFKRQNEKLVLPFALFMNFSGFTLVRYWNLEIK